MFKKISSWFRSPIIGAPQTQNQIAFWCKETKLKSIKTLGLDLLSQLGVQAPITVVKDNNCYDLFRFFSSVKEQTIETKVKLIRKTMTNHFYDSNLAVITENSHYTQTIYYQICLDSNKLIKQAVTKESSEIMEVMDFRDKNNLVITWTKNVLGKSEIKISVANTTVNVDFINSREKGIFHLIQSNNLQDVYNIYSELDKILSLAVPSVNISYKEDQQITDQIIASSGSITFYCITRDGKSYSLNANGSWTYNDSKYNISYISMEKGPTLKLNVPYVDYMDSKDFPQFIKDTKKFIEENLQKVFH